MVQSPSDVVPAVTDSPSPDEPALAAAPFPVTVTPLPSWVVVVVTRPFPALTELELEAVFAPGIVVEPETLPPPAVIVLLIAFDAPSSLPGVSASASRPPDDVA